MFYFAEYVWFPLLGLKGIYFSRGLKQMDA